MKAPSFSLPDQNGAIHSLTDYSGKWIVLYFYPKDDTPGCTKEACEFRDLHEEFKKKNIAVLGLSKDSVTSHKKFGTKHNLPFPLLSDTSLEILSAYGAWGEKKFMGRTYQGILRKTVVISPDGEIKKVYPNVFPLGHAQEVLRDIHGFLQKKP